MLMLFRSENGSVDDVEMHVSEAVKRMICTKYGMQTPPPSLLCDHSLGKTETEQSRREMATRYRGKNFLLADILINFT